MQIIFAKGKTFASNIITSVEENDVSHVAISSKYFLNNQIVFHSSVQGVEIVTRNYFKKKHDIKRTYDINTDHDEELLLKNMMGLYEGKAYDYLATLYIGIYLLLKKVGLQLLARNLWNNRNHFMCLEFASVIIFGFDYPEIMGLKEFEKRIEALVNSKLVSSTST